MRLDRNVERRQKFSIKVIKKCKWSDLRRLDRESLSLTDGKHKHIVGMEEVFDSKNITFVVMQFCRGGSMVVIARLYQEDRM